MRPPPDAADAQSPRSLLRSALLLQAGAWRWRVGVEAALAIAIPAGWFALAGHPAQGLIASLGSFTVLYFSTTPRSRRAVLLPFVGAGLILAAAAGALAAGSLVWTVAALLATTALATSATLWSRTGPPGALMFVLVAGVSGFLAGRSGHAASIPLLVAIGVAGAYLVVMTPLLLARRRPAVQPGDSDGRAARRRPDAAARAAAVRIVTAATLAALLGAALGIERIYWVVVAAVAVLQTDPVQRRVVMRAVHRALGSVLGIGLFALLALLRPAGVALVLLLAVLQAVAEGVIARHYGLALVFITPIPLLIARANSTAGLADAAAGRLLDTLLGCAVAVAVYVVDERRRAHHDRSPE